MFGEDRIYQRGNAEIHTARRSRDNLHYREQFVII